MLYLLHKKQTNQKRFQEKEKTLMANKTMKERAMEQMKKDLGNAWGKIVNEMNDGKYHKSKEIAQKFDLTIGEVASNLTCFREDYSTLGHFTVKSKITTRRFAELDEEGNMTGVVIEKKGCFVWKLGDAEEIPKGEAEKLLTKAKSRR